MTCKSDTMDNPREFGESGDYPCSRIISAAELQNGRRGGEQHDHRADDRADFIAGGIAVTVRPTAAVILLNGPSRVQKGKYSGSG